MKKKLIEIGFTEYEAKAYIALLHDNPATAYELAKNAAIPSSKIYEVIARLLEKGIVSELEEGQKKKYIPKPSDEMIDAYKSRIDNTLNSLKAELSDIKKNCDLSYIWNITDYSYLVDKASRMINDSGKSLLISIWPQEFKLLKEDIENASKKGVKTAVIHYGKVEKVIGTMYEHPIEDTVYNEKGGRGIVIVSDNQEALSAKIDTDNSVQGANSTNEGFVTITEDYLKHDIYIMKIVKRFDPILIKYFGANYHHLRDVYTDFETMKGE